MKKFLFVFIVINIVLTGFYLDTWENGNTTSRVLPVITYFEKHTFQIDKYQSLTYDKSYINNHYYSEKAPLPTFIVMPFFWFCKTVGLIKMHKGSFYGKKVYILGDIICSILPFVLIITLTFKNVKRNKTIISPVLLCMLPFYGSFLFIFSQSYFPHIFSGMLLLFSYIFLKKEKYFWSGIFLGLAFLSEYMIAIAFPVWILQIYLNTRSFKKSFNFLLGFIPSLIFILGYNFYFTSNPFVTLYNYYNINLKINEVPYQIEKISLNKIWNLTFGYYRGILFYAPVLILIFFSVLKKKNLQKLYRNYIPIFSLIYFMYILMSISWYGGWTYGPRYLSCITILFFYEGIVLLSKSNFSKIIFWCLSVFGLLCAILAKFTVLYSLPSEVMNPIKDILIKELLNGNFNSNNLLTMAFGIQPLLANLIWLFLFVFSLIFLTVWYGIFDKQKRVNAGF